MTWKVIAVVMLVGIMTYLAQGPGATAVADERAGVSAAVLTAVGAGDEHEYIGSKSCKKCHIKVHKSWEAGPHAKAFETLKPGNAAEEKTKHSLDPAKDYTTDEKCLQCHTVGFGKPGGYAIPDAADESAVKKAAELAGVGCESCHGPGGGAEELKKEIMKDKRKFKSEELLAKGMMAPTADQCVKCHTEDHPTFDADDKFDFEAMKEKGVHEHEELKLKES